jgi:4-aminobutyrate aminotransferase-like enzyme
MPPLIIQTDEVDEVLDAMDSALAEVGETIAARA